VHSAPGACEEDVGHDERQLDRVGLFEGQCEELLGNDTWKIYGRGIRSRMRDKERRFAPPMEYPQRATRGSLRCEIKSFKSSARRSIVICLSSPSVDNPMPRWLYKMTDSANQFLLPLSDCYELSSHLPGWDLRKTSERGS